MEKQEQPFQIRRSTDFVERYGNVCGIYQTLSDFRLTFGTFGEAPPSSVDERPCIVQHTSILLSPQQAKIVHKMLEQNIEHYEKQFGTIALTSGASLVLPVGTPLPKGKM